uniref:ubiquitinyl hydrolase 1 n=1 Tax=uncultured organism MedDCM-OCT-S08-C51 TaxID=743639 RepID=D6PJA2_9ZZZZ|nr:hypothetical protein [uncultured organism MedDCM-OCT-S08-C51]
MDIKQAVDARAACTLGKGMVLRDHTQACWRMRQIGKGQTLCVVVVPEIERLIEEVKGPAPEVSNEAEDIVGGDQTGLLHDIISWLISNSLEVEGLMKSQLYVQEANNVPRKAALDRLREQPVTAASNESKSTEQDTPEDAKLLPCFVSQLVPQVETEEAKLAVLKEEVPDLDSIVMKLVCSNHKAQPTI